MKLSRKQTILCEETVTMSLKDSLGKYFHIFDTHLRPQSKPHMKLQQKYFFLQNSYSWALCSFSLSVLPLSTSPLSCIHLSTTSSLSCRLEGWPLKCLPWPRLFCYGALSAPLEKQLSLPSSAYSTSFFLLLSLSFSTSKLLFFSYLRRTELHALAVDLQYFG